MASLDTSMLVDLLRRRSRFHRRALAKLDELQARGESLATTRFTVAELYVGIELSDHPGAARYPSLTTGGDNKYPGVARDPSLAGGEHHPGPSGHPSLAGGE